MSNLQPASLVLAVESGNMRTVKNTARQMIKGKWVINFNGAAARARRLGHKNISKYLTKKAINYPLNFSGMTRRGGRRTRRV